VRRTAWAVLLSSAGKAAACAGFSCSGRRAHLTQTACGTAPCVRAGAERTPRPRVRGLRRIPARQARSRGPNGAERQTAREGVAHASRSWRTSPGHVIRSRASIAGAASQRCRSRCVSRKRAPSACARYAAVSSRCRKRAHRGPSSRVARARAHCTSLRGWLARNRLRVAHSVGRRASRRKDNDSAARPP
jgi:hypothetical protein